MFVDIGVMIGIYTVARLLLLATPQYDRPSLPQVIGCVLTAIAIAALTWHVVMVGVEATQMLGSLPQPRR